MITVRFAAFLISLNLVTVLCGSEQERWGLFKKSNDSTGLNNPDAYLTTPQIIARHGYPSETHIVLTEDGYLLTVHRIPYSKHSQSNTPGQPLFLQHGIIAASADWVLDDNSSLAFVLSDAGYDVWIGNARGNSYSQAHMQYIPKDERFWNFSFHEMGVYDVPAVLTYIAKRASQSGKIIYVGHSMGTSMFFVYASIFPEASSIVSMMVAMAPVAFANEVRSPIRYLAPFSTDIKWLLDHVGHDEVLPNNDVMKALKAIACDHDMAEEELCENLLFLLTGFDKAQAKTDNLPVILNHSPDSASVKTAAHYGQIINKHGRFAEYDYGSAQNMKLYGTKTPPKYNVSDITIPIYLMSSDNDWFAGREDVKKLAGVLSNLIEDYVVPYKKFTHLDFVHGKDAFEMVYKPMLQAIAQYGGK